MKYSSGDLVVPHGQLLSCGVPQPLYSLVFQGHRLLKVGAPVRLLWNSTHCNDTRLSVNTLQEQDHGIHWLCSLISFTSASTFAKHRYDANIAQNQSKITICKTNKLNGTMTFNNRVLPEIDTGCCLDTK